MYGQIVQGSKFYILTDFILNLGLFEEIFGL